MNIEDLLKNKKLDDLKALYVVLEQKQNDIIHLQMLNCFCNANKKEAKRFILHTLINEHCFQIEENRLDCIENLNKKQQLLYFLVKNNIDINTMDRDGSYDIGTVGLHAYDGVFEVMGVDGEPISYCFKTLKGLNSFLSKKNLIKKCWTENYNYEEICKEIGI